MSYHIYVLYQASFEIELFMLCLQYLMKSGMSGQQDAKPALLLG